MWLFSLPVGCSKCLAAVVYCWLPKRTNKGSLLAGVVVMLTAQLLHILRTTVSVLITLRIVGKNRKGLSGKIVPNKTTELMQQIAQILITDANTKMQKDSVMIIKAAPGWTFPICPGPWSDKSPHLNINKPLWTVLKRRLWSRFPPPTFCPTDKPDRRVKLTLVDLNLKNGAYWSLSAVEQDTSLCSFMFLKLTSKEEEMIGWRAAWTEERYSNLPRHLKEPQNGINCLNFLKKMTIWKLRLCFIPKVTCSVLVSWSVVSFLLLRRCIFHCVEKHDVWRESGMACQT